MNIDFYKNKCIKCKIKYSELQNNIRQTAGAKNNIIIHISGLTDAGKITLGNKLKKHLVLK